MGPSLAQVGTGWAPVGNLGMLLGLLHTLVGCITIDFSV